jgi:hypothetical protein
VKKLQISQDYPIDLEQIARILQQCQNAECPPNNETIADALGIGSERVGAYNSIARAFGLITKKGGKNVLSSLGQIVMRYDQFCTDSGTHWYLHYHITGASEHIVWNTLAQWVADERQLARSQASNELIEVCLPFSKAEKSLRKHIPREVAAFVDLYSNGRFSSLRFITETDRVFRAGPSAPVPDLVLLATAILYRDRTAPGATALEVRDLLYGASSPGRLMRISESRLRDAFGRLDQSGLVHVERKADLDQIRLGSTRSPADALELYYQEIRGE